jgi:hypothetical protein
MPIRINLLNEVLAEEELRRRDPVKRAIFIGAFLVALSLVWFSSTWLEGKLIQQKKGQVEIEIDLHTNEFSQVEANVKKITDSQHQLNALLQLNTNRFLQGTLLNALQKVYVRNVQLLRIKLDQSFVTKEGTPDKTNSYGVVRGRPATSTEHIVLTLDARDSSPNPGDQVNHYKEALAGQDFFKSELDPTNGVKLANLSSPQSAFGGKPFVLFTLECQFPDKTR